MKSWNKNEKYRIEINKKIKHTYENFKYKSLLYNKNIVI